jgi:phage tail sheath protein FI
MIETLHPGVYVVEVVFHARPIDGVSTSTGPFVAASPGIAEVEMPHTPSPDWTQTGSGDPGITLPQLFAFLGESLQFRSAAGPLDRHMLANAGEGIADGLAVQAGPAGSSTGLNLAAGVALTPTGQPVEPAGQLVESDRHAAHRIRKP